MADRARETEEDVTDEQRPVRWITEGCDHNLVVPLYAQHENGWTDEVVGHACDKCWTQVWVGETVAWTGTSTTLITRTEMSA
jgi:hypothetical protein